MRKLTAVASVPLAPWNHQHKGPGRPGTVSARFSLPPRG